MGQEKESEILAPPQFGVIDLRLRLCPTAGAAAR